MRLFTPHGRGSGSVDRRASGGELPDPLVVARTQLDLVARERAEREEAFRIAVDSHRREVDALIADRDAQLAALAADRDAQVSAVLADRDARIAEYEGRSAAVIAELRSEVTRVQEGAEAQGGEQAERLALIEEIAQSHLCAEDETDEFAIGANNTAVLILDVLDRPGGRSDPLR